MLEFLIVVAVCVLVGVGLVVATAWLLLRRLLRSRPVVVGSQLVAEGMLALAAFRPGPIANRAAALRAVRISRGHRLLHDRVTAAQRSGAYLGDVPAVLPRLEAEGRRIRDGLGRLVGGTTADPRLLARADRHLATLADLTEAVATATGVPVADETLAHEAEEAALGLRLHSAAYTELMAPGSSRDQASSSASR
ncbi:MAG TPA: hypothetical protein VGN47_02650 [Blastococcus sp.]|jgi:hypothetical protein|nr:hypothetical protein [Blastococcus sp.]